MSPVVGRVAVAGAGGMGREALAWLRDARPDLDAVAFLTADASERPVGADVDLPVISSIDRLVTAGVVAVVLGIGDGAHRRKVAEDVRAAGLASVTVVHPTAFLGPGIEVGDGCIIAPGSVLTRDVRLGQGVIVNYGANLGHDCAIGDFAFIGPGAVLAGGVQVGDGAFIGAGGVVLPGLSLARGATVGAGAVVTRDVAEGVTVVGSPARDTS